MKYRLLFAICFLFAADPSVRAGTHQEKEKGRPPEAPIFDRTLLSELVISKNFIGKTAFPDPLPFQEAADDKGVDLTKLEDTDARWRPAIRDFWAPKIRLIQRELEAIREVLPKTKIVFPTSLRISGISDISEVTSDLVPSDFTNPDALRFKLLQRCLVGSPDAAFLARSYALSKSKGEKGGRFAIEPGLRFSAENIGKYNTHYRTAKRLEAESPVTFQESVDRARLSAISSAFYDLHNAPSIRGMEDVTLSLLADFAKKSGRPSTYGDWLRVLAEAEKEESLVTRLDRFHKALPEERRGEFEKLRAHYGLTVEAIDGAIRQMNAPVRIDPKKGVPSSMPNLGGWTVAPEKVEDLPNRSHSYTVDRNFVDYGSTFPVEFVEVMSRLGRDGHWLDGGSGDGIALETFRSGIAADEKEMTSTQNGETKETNARRLAAFQRIFKKKEEDRPRVTGVTLQSDRKNETFDGRLRVLKGRGVEEIPDKDLGKADVITDMFGALSYANQVDDVLNKYLSVLKMDGKIFVHLGNEKIWIKSKGGRDLSLRDWLADLPGLDVRRTGTLDKRFEISMRNPRARVPRLRLVYSDASSPPKRVYVEE